MKYLNKFSGGLLVLAITATTAVAEPATCTVVTSDAKGIDLAQVGTGDGAALTCSEAKKIAAVLNARHNNGKNPIVAKVFKQ